MAETWYFMFWCTACPLFYVRDPSVVYGRQRQHRRGKHQQLETQITLRWNHASSHCAPLIDNRVVVTAAVCVSHTETEHTEKTGSTVCWRVGTVHITFFRIIAILTVIGLLLVFLFMFPFRLWRMSADRKIHRATASVWIKIGPSKRSKPIVVKEPNADVIHHYVKQVGWA